MEAIVEKYLDRVKGLSRGGTYNIRKGNLEQFSEWCETRGYNVRNISSMQLDEYLVHLNNEGYSPNTIGTRFDSLSVLFSNLTELYEVREENPMEPLTRSDYVNGGSMKHSDEAITYASLKDVELLCEYVPKPRLRNELLIRLLFQTGLRESEAASIKLQHLDREARSIRVLTKKRKKDVWRTVYYQPSLDFLLTRWLDGGYRDSYTYAAESDYLFVTRRAGRIRDEFPNKVIRKAAAAAEEDGHSRINEVADTDYAGTPRYRITAHTLRHGHAVQALKSGIDIRSVQKQLGHTNIEQTMVYLQFVDDDVAEAYRRWGTDTA